MCVIILRIPDQYRRRKKSYLYKSVLILIEYVETKLQNLCFTEKAVRHCSGHELCKIESSRSIDVAHFEYVIPENCWTNVVTCFVFIGLIKSRTLKRKRTALRRVDRILLDLLYPIYLHHIFENISTISSNVSSPNDTAPQLSAFYRPERARAHPFVSPSSQRCGNWQ